LAGALAAVFLAAGFLAATRGLVADFGATAFTACVATILVSVDVLAGVAWTVIGDP
jgi:hypothetical protein